MGSCLDSDLGGVCATSRAACTRPVRALVAAAQAYYDRCGYQRRAWAEEKGQPVWSEISRQMISHTVSNRRGAPELSNHATWPRSNPKGDFAGPIPILAAADPKTQLVAHPLGLLERTYHHDPDSR